MLFPTVSPGTVGAWEQGTGPFLCAVSLIMVICRLIYYISRKKYRKLYV